jgi:diguanylate cyclase (GGDEF)-like protein
MTGLFNRRYFNEMAINLFSLVQKTNISMSIIILDIDDFKLINDTYGHFCGDEVICSIANLLKQSTRNSDICVRFGGEEFVVVLPNTSLENGVKIAEKIRQAIEKNVVYINTNQEIHYTVSLGISEVGREDNSLEVALNKADVLLYEAKRLGKNQVKF